MISAFGLQMHVSRWTWELPLNKDLQYSQGWSEEWQYLSGDFSFSLVCRFCRTKQWIIRRSCSIWQVVSCVSWQVVCLMSHIHGDTGMPFCSPLLWVCDPFKSQAHIVSPPCKCPFLFSPFRSWKLPACQNELWTISVRLPEAIVGKSQPP